MKTLVIVLAATAQCLVLTASAALARERCEYRGVYHKELYCWDDGRPDSVERPSDGRSESPPPDEPLPPKLPTYSPSFDCGDLGALSMTQQTICRNKGLSDLDRRLLASYSDLEGALVGAEADDEARNLLAQQAHWNASLSTCGNDYNCINRKYRARIVVLRTAFEERIPSGRLTCSVCSSVVTTRLPIAVGDPMPQTYVRQIMNEYSNCTMKITHDCRHTCGSEMYHQLPRCARFSSDASYKECLKGILRGNEIERASKLCAP